MSDTKPLISPEPYVRLAKFFQILDQEEEIFQTVYGTTVLVEMTEKLQFRENFQQVIKSISTINFKKPTSDSCSPCPK